MTEDRNETQNVNNALHESEENQSAPLENEVSDEVLVTDAEAATEQITSVEIDYDELVREDLSELRESFPELRGLKDITDLDNPVRYGALRDLGLSAQEAYLATRATKARDNRSHLRATRTVSVGASYTMSEAEMSAARELFPGVSDSQIRQLYKRVTKQ